MDTKAFLLKYLTNPLRQFEGLTRMPYCTRFFIPDDRFVEWCKENYPNSEFVDCGAGQGHITKLLRDNGIEAVGVDLYVSTEDTVIDDIVSMDSVFYPFEDEYQVALMCRPCRGEWIHATIIKAVERNCPMLYVGKQSHFESDIAPLPYKVELVLSNVGKDGENMWLVTK